MEIIPRATRPLTLLAAAAVAMSIFPGSLAASQTTLTARDEVSTGVTNVKDRRFAGGAAGDGVRDDTAAIQAAIAAAKGAPLASPARAIYFPSGTYKLTAGLLVNAGQINLVGAGRYATTLVQHGRNVPIFYWTDGLSGGLHSVRVEHMGLTFRAQASAGDTKQYGIMFAMASAPSAAVVGDADGGPYLCTFSNLLVSQSYVGIGVYTSGKGSSLMWSCLWDDIFFRDTRFAAIDLFPNVASGMPHNTIRHCDVLNYGIRGGNLGPAIRTVSSTGLVIDHLNIEDWCCKDGPGEWRKLLYFSSSSYVVVNGLRTERIQTQGTNPRVVEVGGTILQFNGASFSLSTQEGGNATCVSAAAGSVVDLRGVEVARNDDMGLATTHNTIQLCSGDATSKIVLDSYRFAEDAHPTVESLPSTSLFGPGLYARVRSFGLPPVVDVLPPASAAYRGREFTVHGDGARSSDTTWRCERSASGNYSWKPR